MFIKNSELKRNIWLEISPMRLLISPLIIGVLTLIVYLGNRGAGEFAPALSMMCLVLLAIVLYIWAMKLASESILNEVGERTWIFQRMSAVSPWSMSIGKLFGTTIYSWYTACVLSVLYFIAIFFQDDTYKMFLFGVSFLFLAVALHAFIILVSLLKLKRDRLFGRTGKNILFLVGIIGGAYILNTVSQMVFRGESFFVCYGITLASVEFLFVIISFSCFWSLVGLYRCMRKELHFQNTPIVWLIFLGSLLLFVSGFTLYMEDIPGFVPGQFALWVSTILIGALLYLVFVIEPFNIIDLKLLSHNFIKKQWKDSLILIPLWIPSLVIFAILSIILFITEMLLESKLAILSLTIFLFIIRDIALLSLIKIRVLRKGGFYMIITLLFLYGLLPTICYVSESFLWLHIFYPIPEDSAVWQITPVALQTCIALIAFYRRFHKHLFGKIKVGGTL